jgi:TRAP-type uncharacterized transport system substrate-binding protein
VASHFAEATLVTEKRDPTSASDGQSAVSRPLYDRFGSRTSPREAFAWWWPWVFLSACLLAAAWFLVKPAPPTKVVLAAGPRDGAYNWFAERYAETFAASGVTLEIRPTLGSVENYHLLNEAAKAQDGLTLADDTGVSVAMVQSGTCPEGITAELHAIASLYLEPIWIFHRGDRPLQLADLAGRSVAVGPVGSGGRSIAERLFRASGIVFEERASAPFGLESLADFANTLKTAGETHATTAPTTQPAKRPPVMFDRRGGTDAADALQAGYVDAAVFVLAPRHPLAAKLLKDPSLKLMSFDRHEAFARNFPFLSDVKLPRGTVDLANDLPAQDVYLLAPAANLVCRSGTHPAIVSLMIKAATAAHERGDLLSPPNRLPSTQYIEFPLDPAADDYFRHGQPFLQRVLPFGVAAFVDRMKILLLPLITLLIPLIRLLPPMYVWRIRSRIYRWYKVLQEIDRKLRQKSNGPPSAELADDLLVLQQMELELADQKVPLSYMGEFYNLRLHTDYLRRRLEARLARKADPSEPAPPAMGATVS